MCMWSHHLSSEEEAEEESNAIGNGGCRLETHAVSVSCKTDSRAACNDKKEVPWGGYCYSLHNRPMSKDNAARACKRMGKSLVLVTSQSENDALSELLLSTGMNSTGQLSSVWIQTPTTRDSLKFFKWWPGWDRGLHSRNFPRALMQVPGGVKPGITLSRKFDGRLTDYYFWNIKPSNISLPFICEKKQRRQEELGCFYGQVWSLT